jgi:trehalose utilization protein
MKKQKAESKPPSTNLLKIFRVSDSLNRIKGATKMNITIWNEYWHEQSSEKVRAIYPNGIHNTLADIVSEIPGAVIRTATLFDENFKVSEDILNDELLNNTDVLIWWQHCQAHLIPDEISEKVQARVLKGMGFIPLHSAHYSKAFKRLMGTTCDLRWQLDCEERIFCVNPSHPIADGIPEQFDLEREECYAEFFDIPVPDELIFSAWFNNGEVFRAGCTWRRGYGKIFYFQPGHEDCPTYHNPVIAKIIRNACLWAKPQLYRPVEETNELFGRKRL